MKGHLIDLNTNSSFIRQFFNSFEYLDLNAVSGVQKFEPQYQLESLVFSLSSGEDLDSRKEELESKLSPVISLFEEVNLDREFSAVAEIVLNAYIHGNKYDSSKNIEVSYGLIDNSIHVTVEDSGKGIVLPQFVNYLQWLENQKGKIDKNFYQYTELSKPDERGGTGVQIMRYFVDEFDYWLSQKGNLLLRMQFDF